MNSLKGGAASIVVAEAEEVGIAVAAVSALPDRSKGIVEAVTPRIAAEKVEAIGISALDLALQRIVAADAFGSDVHHRRSRGTVDRAAHPARAEQSQGHCSLS